MAYTDIDDPSVHFHTQLYTGNGSADRDITNDANSGDFKPDWLWIKSRSLGGNSHHLFNSNVGMPNNINSDEAYAEGTATNKATAFNTNGFRVQTHSTVNQSSATYVAWQWKANGGTTASNTDGDITSTVQANTTAGFNIVTYTGNGSGSTQTVGHGLGGQADLIIVKNRSEAASWRVLCSATSTGNLFLDDTAALDTANPAAINSANASTFTLHEFGTNNGVNKGSNTYVAYCFKNIQGYSKINTYIGNGSTNGTFVYTGFKPAWVMIKRTDSASGADWGIHDAKRSPFNTTTLHLNANTSGAEGDYSGTACDFLSNGFKHRGTDVYYNASGSTYIYAAFASSPLVSSNGVPTTAV